MRWLSEVTLEVVCSEKQIMNSSSNWILVSFSLKNGLSWIAIQYFIFGIHSENACAASDQIPYRVELLLYFICAFQPQSVHFLNTNVLLLMSL